MLRDLIKGFIRKPFVITTLFVTKNYGKNLHLKVEHVVVTLYRSLYTMFLQTFINLVTHFKHMLSQICLCGWRIWLELLAWLLSFNSKVTSRRRCLKMLETFICFTLISLLLNHPTAHGSPLTEILAECLVNCSKNLGEVTPRLASATNAVITKEKAGPRGHNGENGVNVCDR